jgi:hypothetical protein
VKEFRHVLFVDDFMNNTDIISLNPNHVGMVEQLICANAHTFIGCPLSTFTGYITRIRGYMNNTLTKLKLFDPPTPDVTVTIKEQVWEKNKKGKRKYRYENKTITLSTSNLYARTYYYMNAQMYQLHVHPELALPFWIRDYVEAFVDID